ncbi:hypothetical protein QAD02_008959 [Eretmocerus hayati]|uniref:Uncharacterized protein n=1 Tax=Eretmocerus hayati TaxID=131215 RepID=A0ACC2N8A9_9HYME|nr:hypothetical protein QAD02_008959 [Eretmocerus hayati]
MNKEFSSIDGSVKKHQRESVTPYKIAVLIFIKNYCIVPKTDAIKEKKDFCIVSLKLIQSPDLNKKGFFKLVNSSEYSLTKLSAETHNELESICGSGIQGLLDLFDSLPSMMRPILEDPYICLLSKNSVLGLYVRRSLMMFEKLDFSRIVSLSEELKEYFKTPVDDVPGDKQDFATKKSLHRQKVWGGRQAELLVAEQAHAIITDEHKALSPHEIYVLVKELLSNSPYYAEAHYLNYLNFLRIREYVGAVDSLYHCFDRLAPLESRATSEDKLRTFRYAALNLAACYAQFGYPKMALPALKEAIMLAQEAGDNVCLQLAHSWKYYLMEKNKGPLIERSIAKATALNMPHTASLALIASAHESAMKGLKPQTVFEVLMKSDILNNQYSMIDLLSTMYAEKTALWAYYGKTEMASVCAQLLLLYNSGEKKQLMFNGPPTCQAAVTVANILHEMGEFNLANAVIAHAKERFPNHPNNRIWGISEALHEFSRLMMDEKWNRSEKLAKQIASVDKIEGKFRLVEVYFAMHDFPEALKVAHELEDMKDELTPQQKIRVILHLNEIHCGMYKAGTGQSACNTMLKLSEAIGIARKNHLSYYEAIVDMHIVNSLILLGTPAKALENVTKPLILVLAHGGLYDQARAHITYAKCLAANTRVLKGDSKTTVYLEGIQHLLKAKAHLEKLEANNKLKCVYLLLAAFYNEIGETDERNMYSYELRQLNERFPVDKNHFFLF